MPVAANPHNSFTLPSFYAPPAGPIPLIDAVTGQNVSTFFTLPAGVSKSQLDRQETLLFTPANGSTLLAKNTNSASNSNFSYEIIFRPGTGNTATGIFEQPWLIAAGIISPQYSMYAVTYSPTSLNFWTSFNSGGSFNDATHGPLNNWYYLKVLSGNIWLYNITQNSWIHQNKPQLGSTLISNSTLWLGGNPHVGTVRFDGEISMARFSQPGNATTPTTVPNYTSADVTANDKVFIVKQY